MRSYVQGKVTRQAHVDLPEGTFEEEYARRGFFGRSSHLYRTTPPVNWTDVDEELRPQAICATELPGLGGATGWAGARVAFLENADVTLHMARLAAPDPDFFRNADADEILFVHGGAGAFECDFGTLAYERGDYLVVPRGATYRLAPSAPSTFLVIESTDEVALPERGLLGQHALFDLDVIDVPALATHPSDRSEYRVRVQRQKKLSTITYPSHPFNAVGWKGDLYPWRVNVRDIRPVTSERYHLPPTVHATFAMPNVVVCTFLPRPLETGDPGAMRVPFFHSNIDYDEVIFYHDGDFFSRAGIRPGMVTFHPQGIHHGPQPQAVAASKTKERTTEQAVMLDARRPLNLTAAARRAAVPDYFKSWSTAEVGR